MELTGGRRIDVLDARARPIHLAPRVASQAGAKTELVVRKPAG